MHRGINEKDSAAEELDGSDAPAYHQLFRYETSDEGATVATALRELNECATLAPLRKFPSVADLRLLVETTGEERVRLARTYREMVFAGCGKSLACRDVCPAGIDLAHLMSRSNVAALWHRFA